MLNVVVDTNVLLSSAISSLGNPAQVLTYINTHVDKVCVYYSEEILAEYKDVLSRERFNIDAYEQKEIVANIENYGVLIAPQRSNIPMVDEKDRMFYDAVKDSNAILITGNLKHFRDLPDADNFVMSPSEFLERCRQLEREQGRER